MVWLFLNTAVVTGKKTRASDTARAAALTRFQRRERFFSEFSSKKLIAISS